MSDPRDSYMHNGVAYDAVILGMWRKYRLFPFAEYRRCVGARAGAVPTASYDNVYDGWVERRFRAPHDKEPVDGSAG